MYLLLVYYIVGMLVSSSVFAESVFTSSLFSSKTTQTLTQLTSAGKLSLYTDIQHRHNLSDEESNIGLSGVFSGASHTLMLHQSWDERSKTFNRLNKPYLFKQVHSRLVFTTRDLGLGVSFYKPKNGFSQYLLNETANTDTHIIVNKAQVNSINAKEASLIVGMSQSFLALGVMKFDTHYNKSNIYGQFLKVTHNASGLNPEATLEFRRDGFRKNMIKASFQWPLVNTSTNTKSEIKYRYYHYRDPDILIDFFKLGSAHLPKQIFSYWHSGFDNIEPHLAGLRKLWKAQNPNWKIHELNQENLKKWLPISVIQSIDTLHPNLTLAGKTDMYRMELLKRYGGVWLDATVLTTKPMEEWLIDNNGDMVLSDLVMVNWRTDKQRITMKNSGHFLFSYNTYIMVSKAKDTFINKLLDESYAFFQGSDKQKLDYHWLHNIMQQLIQTDPKFRQWHQQAQQARLVTQRASELFFRDMRSIHKNNFTPIIPEFKDPIIKLCHTGKSYVPNVTSYCKHPAVKLLYNQHNLTC